MADQFVAFNPDALIDLAKWGDIEAISVLFALCKHIDPLGCCNPGDDHLAALSSHRRDRIPALLERLQSANYSHVVYTPVPYRQKPLRDFQVSPYLLRLAPRFVETALERWHSYKPQTMIGNFPIMHGENDRQPDQNQNQNQKQNQNQNQNHLKNQTKSTLEEGDQALAPLLRFPPGEEQSEKPKQGEAQDTRREPTSAASAIPSSAAPHREPRDLTRYKHALATLDDENLALDLVNLLGDISRENARMLVDTYGWERIGRVMAIYRLHTGSVAHPARWTRAMLRKTDEELWKGQVNG